MSHRAEVIPLKSYKT